MVRLFPTIMCRINSEEERQLCIEHGILNPLCSDTWLMLQQYRFQTYRYTRPTPAEVDRYSLIAADTYVTYACKVSVKQFIQMVAILRLNRDANVYNFLPWLLRNSRNIYMLATYGRMGKELRELPEKDKTKALHKCIKQMPAWFN